MKPKILSIDGYNLLHRARSGFSMGEYPVVYNFFRALRALIELHKPTRVYFVSEGIPKKRLEIADDYKANREVDPSNVKKLTELESFHRQKRIILDVLSKHFPLSVVRHPDYEADDVIYTLVKRSTPIVPWIVASTDTDFIQLIQKFSHVSLYNTVKKEFVTSPNYDYLIWKSLRGDASDNIKGLPGVGDKTAEKLCSDPETLRRFLSEDDARRKQFLQNLTLIEFQEVSEEELSKFESSSPTKDWDVISSMFLSMGFKSMLKERTWQKFTDTFDSLWRDE